MVACASVLTLATNAKAQDQQPWWNGAPGAPAQSAPPASVQAPAPVSQAPPVPEPPPGEPPPGAAPQAQAPANPPQAEPTVAPAPPVTAEMASQGEWVYTAQYWWTWVPYGSTTTTVSAEPYVYLYAPSFGWRWFVSPWGVGPFHYGAWGWGPAWGPRYWPHGWAGGHYAPYVGRGAVHFAPRAYAPRAYGAVRVYGGGAHVAGAARVVGGFHGGGGFRGGGGFHGGGGHHR
jgi:uncharacterized membrane protein YgcG